MNDNPGTAQPFAPDLPLSIANESQLDDLLTRPGPLLIEFIRSVGSPLLILGAGGKMGPSLAVLAKRAATQAGHPLEVIAVSRFSDPAARTWLEERGVRTISADLLRREDLANLPDCANLLYLVGQKFGTSDNPAVTWAVNTLVPSYVMIRYPWTRIAALSTGNVYPNVPVAKGGAREDHALTPLGEYANSAVARERIFEFFSLRQGTPLALLRLNYAVELRYGVLSDIAQKVNNGEPIEVTNGYFNCIWQADANEMILRALALAASPGQAWNLTGPMLSVRDVANRFGQSLGKTPRLSGEESDTALVSNTEKIRARLGAPAVPLEAMIRWTAEWILQGGRSLNKPTHFEVTDGQF